MRAYSFWCEHRAPRHFFSQGIEVHPRWKRRSVGLASRIRYMLKLLRISSGDGCFTWKKPAILSTFTSIDLKGCTSLGHPTDPSLWLFGNHPLNRRHLRTIVERQGDQVFDSFWMSWIEQTVKRLANKYVDKKIIENKKLSARPVTCSRLIVWSLKLSSKCRLWELCNHDLFSSSLLNRAITVK